VGGDFFEPAFTFALEALGIDHVIAVAPLFDQLRDQLRRVLQVCVDDDCRITVAVIQARGEGDLLAEVAAQFYDGDARIVLFEPVEYLQCGVATAVIDKDNLGA